MASIVRQEAAVRQQGPPISRRLLSPPMPAVAPRVPTGQLGRALFPFIPRHPDELQVRFNDELVILDACPIDYEGPIQPGDLPPGWLEVQSAANESAKGRVPATYVQYTSQPSGAKAKVLYDYEETEDTGQYLSLFEGQDVLLTAWNADGWHSAYSPALRQYGVIPAGYVELLEKADYSDLFDVLMEFSPTNELSLVNYLGEAVDVSSTDALCKDLIMLFNTRNQVVDLLKASIATEVSLTTSEGTLFRKNSVCTHLMSMYSRLVGKTYLKNTLRPLIVHVLQCQGSFEIDPHRIDEAEDMLENRTTLRLSAQKFLHQLMESVNEVPIPMRRICQALQENVKPRFPAASRKAVGGFFFLRFVCPAIVSPDGFGVIDKLEPRARRALILMSKIMQTLSNGVMFGTKEEFMLPMNDFIQENLENVHFVLDKVATVPPHDENEVEQLEEATVEKRETMYKRLHIHFSLCLRKLLKLMREEGDEELAAKIHDLVIRLGPPPNPSMLKKQKAAASRRMSGALVLSDYQRGPPPANPAPGSRKQLPKRPIKGAVKKTELKKEVKPNPVGENPVPMCMSLLFKKRPGKKLWNKRFFVCYMKGDAIHYYQGPEDMPHKIQGSIDLSAEGTAAHIMGDRGKKGNPSGWEFCIKGPSAGQIHLVANDESTMRQWISCIDRRTRELQNPNTGAHPLKALLSSLEAKHAGYMQQLGEYHTAINACTDAERPMLAQKIEELTLNLAEVKRSIAIAKAT